MALYKANKKTFKTRRYSEARNHVLTIFNQIKKRTKRKPYIRSSYFKKQKIFFDYFWPHLFQKNPRERTKRLKYFEASIELIKNSKDHPFSKQNPNNQSEIFHRFEGLTKNKEKFCVQIKEDKRSGKKYFISCFPLKEK